MSKTSQLYAVPHDAAVQHFQHEIAHQVEKSVGGVELVESATNLFASHLGTLREREHALTVEVRERHREVTRLTSMLTFVQRGTSRYIEIAAQAHTALERARAMESSLCALADEIREGSPRIAERIVDLLGAAADAEGMPALTRTAHLAFHPDTRWSTGVFQRGDSGAVFMLPFAGWVLVASDPRAPMAQAEAAFMLGGRTRSISELERDHGLALQRVD